MDDLADVPLVHPEPKRDGRDRNANARPHCLIETALHRLFLRPLTEHKPPRSLRLRSVVIIKHTHAAFSEHSHPAIVHPIR